MAMCASPCFKPISSRKPCSSPKFQSTSPTKRVPTTCQTAPPRSFTFIETIKRTTASAAAALALLTATTTPAALATVCPTLATSADGLQWCDVSIGKGDVPVKGAFIKVHYDGRLDSDIASGTFDSSYDRGRPLGFAVGTGQVIRGWDEGILGGEGVSAMKEGGKRKLVIPPELGYGNRSVGGVIPANSTLYFDVELIGRVGRK